MISKDVSTTADLQGKRVPDFFVVGHMKSGTTALYMMLRQHPQIFMSYKEPWFLARELRSHAHLRPGGQRTPESLEDYLSLFDAARPDQLVGEASALYLWSQTAAREIADLQPDARIIAVLREPASFLWSLHLQFVQTYSEREKNLRKALSLETARREGRKLPRHEYWPGATLYSEHVQYVKQLRRYEARLPSDQIMVIIYDDFRDDNYAVVRAVWRFLGLEDMPSINVRRPNPTVRVRSQRLLRLNRAISLGIGPRTRAGAAIGKFTPSQLSAHSVMTLRNRFLFGPPKPPDPDLMHELRARYKPEVVALSEHLGRDLVSRWGYDGIS